MASPGRRAFLTHRSTVSRWPSRPSPWSVDQVARVRSRREFSGVRCAMSGVSPSGPRQTAAFRNTRLCESGRRVESSGRHSRITCRSVSIRSPHPGHTCASVGRWGVSPALSGPCLQRPAPPCPRSGPGPPRGAGGDGGPRAGAVLVRSTGPVPRTRAGDQRFTDTTSCSTSGPGCTSKRVSTAQREGATSWTARRRPRGTRWERGRRRARRERGRDRRWRTRDARCCPGRVGFGGHFQYRSASRTWS